MHIHAIFPTLVIENTYQDHDKFKDIFKANALKHLNKDGFSAEATGNVDIHLDDNFEEFFTFISNSVKLYVATLSIDPNIFDFNLVKSWLNISKDSDNPIHNHADAHISFAYYINTPEDVRRYMRFHISDDINAIFPGINVFNPVSSFNLFNSDSWKFATQEGNVFVFPGRLHHSVVAEGHNQPIVPPEQGVKDVEDLFTKRICIAGDFVLTHKDKTSNAMGLQPIKNWRTF